MNIAVCEDEMDAKLQLCENIKTYFDRMSFTGEITAYSSGEEFLQVFQPGKYDLIFLDVYLGGMSGIDIAHKIREVDDNCLILFVTVSMDHAMDGFDVRASGYIIKPVNQEKMNKALHICREKLAKYSRVIEIPNGREGVLSLPLANIQYVAIYNKSTQFFLHGGTFEARITLDDVEGTLGGEPFLRCHRSYIINMNHVEKVCDNDFVMKNGDRVPIRINGRKEVKTTFARFMAYRAAEEVQV